MKHLNAYIILFIFLFTSHDLLGITVKTHKYDMCPKNKQMLIKLQQEAYQKLLALSGTGEGGKLDTLEKRATAEKYRFYSECLRKYGDISSDAKKHKEHLLLSCNSTFNSSKNMLTIDMNIKEKEAYESLKRVEISISDNKGKEYFRAMNNRMSYPAPIPPNAFGVYPIGEKEQLSDKDILDAGHKAVELMKTKYGYLVKGCHTSWANGILTLHWQIHPYDWNFSNGKGAVLVNIVPKGAKNSTWISCGSFSLPVKQVHQKQAIVKLQFYERYSRKRIKDGSFLSVTLVKLKRIPTRGVIIQKRGDTPEKYSYVEVSRKSFDLDKYRLVSLEPGFYWFEYNDIRGNPPAGFYGRSDLFEIKGSEEVTISVWLDSAI